MITHSLTNEIMANASPLVSRATQSGCGTSNASPGTCSRRRAGWSIIELVGVMAVATILAAALVPMLVRKYDQDARDLERKSMGEMADAFQLFVLKYRKIPDHTTVFDNIGLFWGRPKWIVQTNDRGNLRYFLIDGGIRLGTNFTMTNPLPFTQDFRGSTNTPVNPRAMIICSLGPPLPANSGIASGYINTNFFNLLWNLPVNTLPPGSVWDNWRGVGEDLMIKKIDMTSWFDPIRFTSTTNYGIGRFQVDNVTNLVHVTNYALLKNAVTNNPLPYVENHYLHGTMIRFINTNNYANVVKTQAVEIVQAPCNYLYENNVWRVDIKGFGNPRRGMISPEDMEYAAGRFLSSVAILDPSMKPNDMYTTMSNYMAVYVAWSKGQATWNDAVKAAKDMELALKNGITK
jgi:type II secretory pathway pseudopilin PulG